MALLSLLLSFVRDLDLCVSLSLLLFHRRVRPALPLHPAYRILLLLFLSLSLPPRPSFARALFLARFRGSSVDRVSSMRTERGPVWVGSCFGDQQRHQQPPPPSEHRQGTGTTTTTTIAHRHPGRALPPPPPRVIVVGQFLVSFFFLFFRETPILEMCFSVRPIFLCETSRVSTVKNKKKFRALEIGRACIDTTVPASCFGLRFRKPDAIFRHVADPNVIFDYGANVILTV